MIAIHSLFEGTSIVKMDRQRKLNMVGSSMASNLAKKQNDPLYSKLTKARKKYLQYKEMIQRKYGQRGAVAARKSMSSH